MKQNETTMTTQSTIYKTVQAGNFNKITCMIEEAWTNNYSVVVFDEFSAYEGGIFIEKFAVSYDKAVQIADKIIANQLKKYN